MTPIGSYRDDMTHPDANTLNATCDCIKTDATGLAGAFDAVGPASLDAILATRPHLFAPLPLFIDDADLAAMRTAIAVLDRVAALPGFVPDDELDPLAREDHGPHGALMGYDFHLSADGPKLIEINTNAGGALLAARMIGALEGAVTLPPQHTQFEDALIDTFREEWRAQRGAGEPGTVAIVDAAPTEQFLYPEFLLYQALFERVGWRAVIAAPEAFRFDDGALRLGDDVIDLVYLRSTDFGLQAPESAALRDAYASGAAVFTPNPHLHTRLANKRRLVTLSDDDALAALGATPKDRAVLARVVPRTRCLLPEQQPALWSNRRGWFFKPVAGFGSRAAYRGDKLTQGKWREIWDSVDPDGRCAYVAQALIPPPERHVTIDGVRTPLKFDVRAIAYRGQVQLFFARLYQGQTTNMRTQSGGFAAVLPTSDPCCVAANAS